MQIEKNDRLVLKNSSKYQSIISGDQGESKMTSPHLQALTAAQHNNAVTQRFAKERPKRVRFSFQTVSLLITPQLSLLNPNPPWIIGYYTD